MQLFDQRSVLVMKFFQDVLTGSDKCVANDYGLTLFYLRNQPKALSAIGQNAESEED